MSKLNDAVMAEIEKRINLNVNSSVAKFRTDITNLVFSIDNFGWLPYGNDISARLSSVMNEFDAKIVPLLTEARRTHEETQVVKRLADKATNTQEPIVTYTPPPIMPIARSVPTLTF